VLDPVRALGALGTTPDIETLMESDDAVIGAGKIEHFHRQQLLQTLSCTECGRCQDKCPAWNTGKPLNPKLIITSLRDHMLDQGNLLLSTGDAQDQDQDHSDTPERDLALVPTVIDPEALWACTTCGACVEECPVDIEHVDTIVDMRRYQVMMESEFPSEAGTMLRNIENQGNPWGMRADARLDWTSGLDFEVPVVTGVIPDDVEWLYWVGCAGSLDDRAKRATAATASVLHEAGVKFAVLGPRESCTGDPARRMGNEYLFQEMAKANIDTLSEAGMKKIIASCPYCLIMLGDAVAQRKGEGQADGVVVIIDLAQVLADSVGLRKLV
jgi:Fe-S oxidoreductase